ncbi:DJ-1/PfpI family protein [Paludibaculum fermentans]|uniref:DJ-1/PfpI family protein n=1 Tax=Paludibaculum fermentans TaxID=1473598 RepID=UPI003EBFACB4
MSKQLKRKALIAISSFTGDIYPGGHRTGLFFTEALHPYEVLTDAGFEVDLASETGTCGLDFNSLLPPFLAGSDKAVYDNPKHPFQVKLNSQLKKASDVKKEEYGVFFASAGHAALYDYPTAAALQATAADVWNRGGVVAAVCHGAAIMPGIIDAKTGKSIIEGRTVTGFTIEGEMIFAILDKLRADGVVPIVEAVTKVGAYYSSPMNAFDDYSISCGRVVTGVNPQSARSTAERCVRVFDTQQNA